MSDPAMPISSRLPSVRVRWLVLAVLSAGLSALLGLAGLPAAALIGPMIAAAALGVGGWAVPLPRAGFAAGQAIVGCFIAASLTPAIFPAFARDWMLFVFAIVATVCASSVLGWLISRLRVLPGTVGVWGTAPGASTVMVLMAGAFGADQRLVAFMQYLRVVMVSIGAVGIARLWVDTSGVVLPATIWFPAIEPAPFGATIAVAVAGAGFGRLLRLPSPFFLGAFLLGALLHLGAGTAFQIPQWLLSASYVLIGWTIGMQFRSETLRTVGRALPQVVLSILALMAFCGAIAWLLANAMGVDPLTAYLATSPGGMDTVAIIAAASGNVDISFVITMQMMRFLFVLVAGPPIARLVAGWVRP